MLLFGRGSPTGKRRSFAVFDNEQPFEAANSEIIEPLAGFPAHFASPPDVQFVDVLAHVDIA